MFEEVISLGKKAVEIAEEYREENIILKKKIIKLIDYIDQRKILAITKNTTIKERVEINKFIKELRKIK